MLLVRRESARYRNAVSKQVATLPLFEPATNMASSRTVLYGSLLLLTIDGILELAFISSMVRWLHERSGDGPFFINDNGNVFLIRVKPQKLALNQGHASNGAAGTAFIGVGFGGFLILWLRSRQLKRNGTLHGFVRILYNFWLVLTILSAVYTLACFVYVIAKTYTHDKQDIVLAVAERIARPGFPDIARYPRLEWTPQGWFAALLRTPLARDSGRSDIEMHLAIMRGWQWNLIPMTLLGFTVMVFAILDRLAHKQRDLRGVGGREGSKEQEDAFGSSP